MLSVEGNQPHALNSLWSPRAVSWSLKSSLCLQVLSGLGEAITEATQVATQCMSLAATWRDSPAAIDAELYCAWRKSGCATAPTSKDAIRSALLCLCGPHVLMVKPYT